MKIWQKRLVALLAGAGVAAAVYAADIKISALTDGGAAQATDMIPVSRGVLPRRVVLSGYVPATATALAANGTNCDVGSYTRGTDASGNAENCTVDQVGGDASTNTSSSVDSEVAVFSSTGGKTLKRATGTGLGLLTSGVLSPLAVTDDSVAVGNGTTMQVKTLTSCSGASDAVTYNISTNAWGCNTLSSGGATETSGTFTATFVTACTTTPTVDFSWVKIGSIVTLTVTNSSGFSCTSDSTSFHTVGGTGLPVAIRPASSGINLAFGDIVAVDAGVTTTACLNVDNGGNIALNKIVANSCGAWTGTGSKAWTTGQGRHVFSYSVL